MPALLATSLPPPGPLWLESGSTTPGPRGPLPRALSCSSPRTPAHYVAILSCQSFRRALGKGSCPCPVARSPAPGDPKACSPEAQAGSLPGPAVAQAQTPMSSSTNTLALTRHLCLQPEQVLFGDSPFCLFTAGSQTWGLMSAGDSTSPSTPCPCQPPKFYFCT